MRYAVQTYLNKEITNNEIVETLVDMEKENLNYTAKTVALKYITVRFRSEKELRDYLKKKLVDNDIIDIVIKDLLLDSDSSKFSVVFKGEDLGKFEIPLFGKHMVMNSVAATERVCVWGSCCSLLKSP